VFLLQVTIDFSNVQGELDFDWVYHGPLGIHDHGSATVKFSQTSISTLFTFSSDASGRPSIVLTSLDVEIDDLDIHLSGGGAWLINFLIKLFKGALIDTLENKISDVVTADFNNILAAIQAKYPLVIQLAGAMLNTTQLNLGLVPSSAITTDAAVQDTPAAFSISGEYLVVAGELGFTSTTNTTTDGRVHDWIPDSLPANPNGTAPMFGASFDEYVLGSLLFVLTENGVFDMHLDNDMLPPDSLIRLNTHLFATEYPALYAAYPNNNITFDLVQYNGQPPAATTTPTGTTWTDMVAVTLNVIDPNQSDPVVPVCNLLVNYTLNTVFDFVTNATGATDFTGTISPLVFDATVLWADINPDNFASDVQDFVTAITDDVLIPILDGILAKGFALPTNSSDIHATNLFLDYGNHVFSLGFDLAMPTEEARIEAGQALREWVKN
jgi:hypothetical protein